MNNSGLAVKKIISQFPNFPISVIVHDDIDLPVGIIKIVSERGSAGHKGVESIIQNIGNNGLIRFRIGIAPQKNIEAKKMYN
jgi:PTH1 family peptidyl-tRNA hydrolase